VEFPKSDERFVFDMEWRDIKNDESGWSTHFERTPRLLGSDVEEYARMIGEIDYEEWKGRKKAVGSRIEEMETEGKDDEDDEDEETEEEMEEEDYYDQGSLASESESESEEEPVAVRLVDPMDLEYNEDDAE
jgi:hypothetical protein